LVKIMKVFLLFLQLPFICNALVPGLEEKSSSVSSEEFNNLRNEVRSISNQLNEKEDQMYVLLNRLNEKEGEISKLENRVKDLEHSKSISESSAKDQSYVVDQLLFVVAKTTTDYVYVPKGKIVFNEERMDIDETVKDGTFTAPADGLYLFSFNGYIERSGTASIIVYVNDENKLAFSEDFYDSGTDDYRQSTFTFSIELKHNDELHLFNWYDNSFLVGEGSSANHEMTFTGRFVCSTGFCV